MTITTTLPSNTTNSSLTLGNKNYKIIGGSDNVDGTLIVGNGTDKFIGGDNNTNSTVTLGNGNDVFKAGNNDSGSNITLGSGNDTVYSGNDNALATNTYGTAGKGSLTIYDIGSNNTNDTSHYNEKTVVEYVDGGNNNTNNTTFFGDGNVTMIYLSGGAGDSADNVTAGNGNDILLLAPNSQLTAGNGLDKIRANQNDTITLGNGNDTVHAGPNDTISLGTGLDTVVFAVSPYPLFIGEETISGFSPAHDVIKINHTLIGSFAGASGSVLADAHQVGLNTVITIDASDQITLTGVALSSLHSHNFVFV